MRLEDLKLYNECLDFESRIWKLVGNWEGFNKDTIGLSFVNAADAISSNIAEGYGRYNFSDKKNYCYVSRGFLLRTKGWLLKAKERELISEEETDELLEFIEKLHRMLNAYIRSIGRKKPEPSNYNKEENNTAETVDGNTVTSESSETEPNGNSFTASADEFFSKEELADA